MFPFWEIAIAPVLEAAGVQKVVEIGALRGDHTRLIIDRLGPKAELHVIDPAPGFDPTEHAAQFGGQYIFHRALSVDILGSLPPMDAALVDGDHNWFTVYNELRLLRQVARDAKAPLPILILHDVGWPYGRRDLYYAPETIPVEFRQPHRRAGMRFGQPKLVNRGGMSAGHWNAEVEGGPRNGVMTALEDFLAEHDRPVRTVILPLYFGLAIVVEEERLSRQPQLAAALDRLESSATKGALLELGEEIRLRSVAQNHTLIGERNERIGRLAGRYLDSVIREILNEARLESEVALDHLLNITQQGGTRNEGLIADPVRRSPVAFEKLRQRRRTGSDPSTSLDQSDLSLSRLGRFGLEKLDGLLGALRAEGIPGDVAICGAGRGGTGILIRAHLDAHDDRERQVWLADRFHATDGAALNRVRDNFERFALLDDRVHLLQGDLAATLPDFPAQRLALLVLGDLSAAEIRSSLDHLYPRVAPGGTVVIEDMSAPETAHAVEAFRTDHGLTEDRLSFGSFGATWTKQAELGTTPLPIPPSPGAARSPLAVPRPTTRDLSVVVVFYNMRREAARTLKSLSRSYQRGIEQLDYQVVVVENGSAPEERLGEEFVRSFGDEFTYLDLGADAKPSPAYALNRGIAISDGNVVGLMVDGAHVLSPGVLRYAMAGMAAYPPAVVATQAWYVGPGQQGESMRSGYDQTAEDTLFERISWPQSGYRLFEISHFIGDRDWLEGLWESNCLFATRKQLEQVGGFDEGFAMAGGGYTNLDLYERLASAPDIELVTILGEGSFHQVHGGTTTNLTDPMERRTKVHGYTTHYADLRGRSFIGPERPLRYVGAFETNEAKRTRSRRMTATAFDIDRSIEGNDGPLGAPTPVPEDLRDSFINAYWRSQAWRRTSWVGNPVQNAPTDLMTYQEIITEVRPDWVIETGTGDGGRALFLASICELLAHGQVVSVGPAGTASRPTHPRLTYVEGAPQLPETVAKVRAITGSNPNGLVILGTRGRRNRMRDEFEAYASMAAIGSYAIMEHTMLNGWPVDGSFGRGPFETVRGILATRGDFVVDTEREKHSLTFNPFGFLRRIQ